jgi:hypothetical protein
MNLVFAVVVIVLSAGVLALLIAFLAFCYGCVRCEQARDAMDGGGHDDAL